MVKYVGSEPLPPKVSPDDGFELPRTPESVLKDPRKPIQTFPRSYFHKWEPAYAAASKEAIERYTDDQCAYPPRCYEANSLMWKGVSQRQPNSRERLALQGYPASTLEPLVAAGRSASTSESARCSLIGNAFNPYSAMAFFYTLLWAACGQAHTPPQIIHRPQFSVFDLAYLDIIPKIKRASNLRQDLSQIFAPSQPPPHLIECVEYQGIEADILSLQSYWAWAQDRGISPWAQGPEWSSQYAKATLAASLGTQRYTGNSSLGLDHLIRPDSGNTEHIAAATQLRSPFALNGSGDSDIRFTPHAFAVLGRRVRRMALIIGGGAPALAQRRRGPRSLGRGAIAPGREDNSGAQQPGLHGHPHLTAQVAGQGSTAGIHHRHDGHRPDGCHCPRAIGGQTAAGPLPVSHSSAPPLGKDDLLPFAACLADT